MFNLLSYIGVNMQSELCLWTLLGLIRTIFDATLFKVNANLKQVWQMSMPGELSMPVQRGLRTMISGIMLLQCFSVYVYLASYIVLLYPVFLEERPALVLPWLLLAAIRKLLCELTSLALGLGTCVLLGPARPACVRFLVVKVATITPAFYMWMLVFSYYSTLKMASKFKAPVGLAASDHDYGLELAVRRRRTKSLQDEDVLRRKLVASLNYGEGMSEDLPNPQLIKQETNVRMVHSTTADYEDIKAEMLGPTVSLAGMPAERVRSDVGSYEDWFGSELVVPRDTDRILEQFVIMMLRIGVYMNGKGADPTKLFSSHSRISPKFECSNLANGTETPPLVGSHRGRAASYIQNYPQIFMKKPSQELLLIPPEFTATAMQDPQTERDRGQMLLTEQIYPINVPSVVTPSEEPHIRKVLEQDYNSNLNLVEVDKKESVLNLNKNTECCKKGICVRVAHMKPIITSSQTAVDFETNNSQENTQVGLSGNKSNTSTQIPLDRPIFLHSEHSTTNATKETKTDYETQSASSLQKIIERMKRSLPRKTSENKSERSC